MPPARGNLVAGFIRCEDVLILKYLEIDYLEYMTEEALRKLPLDDLLAMLTRSTKELTYMIHKENEERFDAKEQEVELIQKIIVEKRAEFRPGFPI